MPPQRCVPHYDFSSETNSFGILRWHWSTSLALGVLIPVKNLKAVPMQHALGSRGVFIERFKVFDSVRLAADVGMDGERHDLGALLALEVKAVELVDGALKEMLALMVLHDHHRDVVELDRIGQGYERPIGGADGGRLVVIDPVADIFDAGCDQQLRCLERLCQARPEPADRARSGEALDGRERALDHGSLVRLLMNGALLIGVAHELPAGALGLLRHSRIVLADAGVHRQRGPDAETLE